ncbi:MAG: anti-sigma factor [Reyranellaceae bacterium]
MDCPTCESLVDAYLDGELSAPEGAAFERALAECPDCRRRLDGRRGLRALLRELPAEPAPDLLRARVERALPRPARPAFDRRRWLAVAASLIVAVGIGWAAGLATGSAGRERDALLAGYLRVALSDSGVEVASSDRHTVKPWFAGRIDYAPPVNDLTSVGFPLLGGRVDVIDGRRVAVLVYRRNQHRIALMIWPARSAGSSPASVAERDGFVLAEWRQGGFEMRAVSDLAPDEMKAFAAAVDRAIDGAR